MKRVSTLRTTQVYFSYPIRHPEGCMKACYTATILLATATAATFQSLDQTFDEISSKLQAAQQTLSPPPPGTKVQMPSDVVIYSRPAASASTPLKLEAQTPVTFQGTENGFVKLTTQNVPQPFYVKDGKFTDRLTSGVGSAVNDKLKSAVDTLKGLANDLRENPYVRLKGFSLDVSIYSFQ